MAWSTPLSAYSSPKRRIARARQHVAEIETSTQHFFDANPCIKVTEPAADGYLELKLKMTTELPPSITDLAHEAVEALRSALDQAIHPIANATAQKRPDLIHFPAADTEADFNNAFNSYLKELPTNVKSYLRSLKVYQEGDTLLWGLNRMRRQSAHRMIVPVGHATDSVHIIHMRTAGGFQMPMPTWDAAKCELVFLRVAPGGSVDADISINFYVAFGPSEGLAGVPVVDGLRSIANRVEEIVLELENQFSQIGGST